MARYTGPVCKLCRREGVKLFLKGSRCDSPKCAVTRREVVPGGQKGRRGRSRATEYGKRFRETIKFKRFYGVLEAQFRRYVGIANQTKGSTGETLLKLMAANGDNAFAQLVYFLTAPFLAVFVCLTQTPSFGGFEIEFYDLIAILVYFVLSWAIIRLLWILFARLKSS